MKYFTISCNRFYAFSQDECLQKDMKGFSLNLKDRQASLKQTGDGNSNLLCR